MNRRTFTTLLGAGTIGAVLAGTPIAGSQAAEPQTEAQSRRPHPPATRFGPLKRIRAGELDTGYVELGPAAGQPVVLMHGFPYDIHSYAEVAPLLAAAGFRVIVPYFRGYGTTRFRSPKTPRSAQQTAFALDILALMDALSIKRAVLAGYDWGSRTGNIIAALWPHRVRALVSVTGYLITNLQANRTPLPPRAEWAWWYQYYFATERGRQGLADPTYRMDLARLVWTFNSPGWAYDEGTLATTARAFDNPDFVDIVIFNYRWRLSLVGSDPRYATIESRLQAAPNIAVPTITVDGAEDPFTPADDGAGYRSHFTGPYDHRTFAVGHNVPQEDPVAFARAVEDSLRL